MIIVAIALSFIIGGCSGYLISAIVTMNDYEKYKNRFDDEDDDE